MLLYILKKALALHSNCPTGISAMSFFNTLPNDKIVDLSKSKAFADDKINVAEKLKFVFWKGRKHCGKRRKCWLPAFFPFHTMFSKGFFLWVVKSWDCVVKS